MRLFLLCLVTFVSADFCKKNCGDIPNYINGTKDAKYKKKPIMTHNVRTVGGTCPPGQCRIVNGYKVNDRGFVTLIRAYAPDDPENYETCGGTLINR